MSSLPTATLIGALKQGLTEINNLHKTITASKQLNEKNSNPKEWQELNSLVEKYINTKGENVESFHNYLQNLGKAIRAKQVALTHQRSGITSINAELALEKVSVKTKVKLGLKSRL
jgi:hypothetical protein